MKKIFGIAVFGGLVYWLARKAVSIKDNIEFRMENVKFSDINFFDTSLKFNLIITNNNNIDLHVSRLVGDISQGGILLSELSIENEVLLEKKSDSKLAIVAKVKNESLFLRIRDIIQDGGALKPIEIDGFLTVEGIDLPISTKVQFLTY